MKRWKQRVYSFIFIAMFTHAANAELFFLEPNIQGYASSSLVRAISKNSKYYLNIDDMSQSLQFKYDANTGDGSFMDTSFSIDKNQTENTMVGDNTRQYYSPSVFESVLPIKLDINPLEMQLNVQSDLTLPTTRRNKNAVHAQNPPSAQKTDPFSNYEFDNRFFSSPLIDLMYRYNQNITRLGKSDSNHSHGNYYQMNSGLLFLGLDTKLTLFGDDYSAYELNDMRARLTFGKTLLEEPGNIFNLTRFSAGDIQGMSTGLFHQNGNGRGLNISSFKDLVISADKTIDITGSMSNGWQAELYLNNQLIGFRQDSIDGRYQFKDIPVAYGLNDFQVMLYGPFGETQTKSHRYYSGTSPVKSGEIGYNINAYQADRYLFESHETQISESNNLTLDAVGYYGLTDKLTLISGITSTENATLNSDAVQFGTLGAQLALDGVSMQYNNNYNFNNSEIGHHFDVQGNIYIGDIFARYEYYGDTQSPISYYRGKYLQNLFEGRLTGQIPVAGVPYYVAYMQANDKDLNIMRQINFRLSPNFMRYYNLTLENTWKSEEGITYNHLDAILQATYNRFRINAVSKYQTHPESYLNNIGTNAEYRWDRNTFIRAGWSHDFRSEYTPTSDLDTFSVGLGRLFKFGGITITAMTDTDRNLSFGLAYNISFGHLPGHNSVFANPETQMADYGTIYARMRNQNGDPVSDAKLIVNGRPEPVITNKLGDALITNLEPYQKSTLQVDISEVSDLSLNPGWSSKKLVLRPGAVRTIDIPFNNSGGIEGKLGTMSPDKSYRIYIKDIHGDIVSSRPVDTDGSFIFDGIAYGYYTLIVVDSDEAVLNKMGIVINSSFYQMREPI